MRVLVTGATGYVGSRLVPRLLEDGHEVLAATRRAGGTDEYPWADQVVERHFDIDETAPEVLRESVRDVDAVVYLVHSLGDDDFLVKDREAAERVASACEQAGVERVVYLSGLIPEGDLSDHLESRRQVEQVFLGGAVPAVVLRAAMVVGAGSTSFELLKRLTERLPVIPVPSWMRRDLQPVAIEDVVHVIARSLEGRPGNAHYDIGGDQVLSYPSLLRLFARITGRRRLQVVVPWVPAGIVGRICGLVSGLPVAEVVSLVASLDHDLVCHDRDRVRRDLLEPGFAWTPLDEAIRRSLDDTGPPPTSRHGDVQGPARTDPA